MNKLKLFLMKQIYKIDFQKSKKIKLYNGNEIEVIISSEEDPFILAQATIFNTIIINQSVLSRYKENTQDYILMHEYAHTKQKISFLFMPLMIFSVIVGLLSLPFSIGMLLGFIIKHNYLFLSYTIFLFVISFLAIGLFSILSWYLEIDADYYSIKHIGKNNALNAIDGMKSKAIKIKFIYKVIGRLTHPPFWVPMKIYDFINK